MAERDGRELARVLLDKAAKDEAAVRLLVSEASIADEVIGLHAQQAVEKSLKAVLAWNGVSYRLTHDIAYLTEQLADARAEVPGEVVSAETLTPWAAELRYDEPLEPEDLDREAATAAAAAALAWAAAIVVPDD